MFVNFGLKRVEEDEALYFKHDKDGMQEEMISTHIDDSNIAGTESFLDKESFLYIKSGG